DGVREDVKQAVLDAIKSYEEMGAEIVWFDLPELKFALPCYYILAMAEASSNLGRYDGIRYGYKAEHYNGTHDMICRTRSEGFGKEVQRRILMGTYVLSAGYYDAYYKKAVNLRGAIVEAFDRAFEQCDVILAPTAPVTAFKSGYLFGEETDQLEQYLSDICTVPVNTAGLPAVSIPCGEDSEGLPIGMQLIGKKFDEKTILNLAYKYEEKEDKFKETKWGVKL
ncbi:MAG: Asp-tRNA(Asn)/Glu-tRNA(Gln) amidotransferase subunit GatA, partial [Ruminococcus sp.]|nr:Asp-tRNA(Asn)/Glu-tRNA(Gln) amidotransferase subunit GatA [Ruminococcus sp.]